MHHAGVEKKATEKEKAAGLLQPPTQEEGTMSPAAQMNNSDVLFAKRNCVITSMRPATMALPGWRKNFHFS